MFVFTFVAVFTSSRPDAWVVENNPPRSLVEDHLNHLESHPMAHYIRDVENWNVLHTAPEFLVISDQDKEPHVGQQIFKRGDFCQLTSLLLQHNLSVTFTNSLLMLRRNLYDMLQVKVDCLAGKIDSVQKQPQNWLQQADRSFHKKLRKSVFHYQMGRNRKYSILWTVISQKFQGYIKVDQA